MKHSEPMISVEEARQAVLDMVAVTDVVEVGLLDALGLVAAEDLRSDIDITPFDNTAMDGFACRSCDLVDVSGEYPAHLAIVGHIGAGHVFEGEVGPGQTVRIMTGAPMPAGADCVEKIENVTFSGQGTVGDELVLSRPVEAGRNVRFAGEEFRAGDIAIPAGTVLNDAALGLLASTGHATVPVYRRPKVGIVATGSELVSVTAIPGPGQIRDSNSYLLAGSARAAGCDVIVYGQAEDDEKAIEGALVKAAHECDFVLTSGGASAGDFDYITQIAARLGHVETKYVNMRPGKSQTLATVCDTPFVGLAGNPAAAAVGFQILVRPALLALQGRRALLRPVQTASLSQDVKKKDPRRSYLRGDVARDGEGRLIATPAKKQSSALLGALLGSNALVVIPEDVEFLAAGSPVECVRLDIDEGTVL